MFSHNLRLWALGGPCIAVLLLLGGRATALVAAFGVMACYCFDLADNAVSDRFHVVCMNCSRVGTAVDGVSTRGWPVHVKATSTRLQKRCVVLITC